MKLKMNIRIIEGKKQVNCLGYFQSDWFTLESLLIRQSDIYSLIQSKKNNDEDTLEIENLYNVTEHMRVKLNQGSCKKINHIKKKAFN